MFMHFSHVPSLLSNGYQGLWSWPLTSIQCRCQEYVQLYLHSPNTPSWHGAQLKKSKGTPLPLTLWNSLYSCDFHARKVTFSKAAMIHSTRHSFHLLHFSVILARAHTHTDSSVSCCHSLLSPFPTSLNSLSATVCRACQCGKLEDQELIFHVYSPLWQAEYIFLCTLDR
jgi:hypothetical protein